MESERSRAASKEAATSKKLINLAKLLLQTLKKSFTKTKHLIDIALLIKRSHKLTTKTLHSILLSSSNDAVPHYEYTCTTTPTAFSFLKRGTSKPSHYSGPQFDEAHTMAAVQRVLEMINPGDESSPAVWSGQLRITDSPFPVKVNEEEAVKVNIAADDFINKFYSNLRMQKSLAVDSPDRDAWAS